MEGSAQLVEGKIKVSANVGKIRPRKDAGGMKLGHHMIGKRCRGQRKGVKIAQTFEPKNGRISRKMRKRNTSG